MRFSKNIITYRSNHAKLGFNKNLPKDLFMASSFFSIVLFLVISIIGLSYVSEYAKYLQARGGNVSNITLASMTIMFALFAFTAVLCLISLILNFVFSAAALFDRVIALNMYRSIPLNYLLSKEIRQYYENEIDSDRGGGSINE